MPIFDDNVRKQLTDLLSNLENPVKVLFFTQEFECPACSDNHDFINEFSALSDKITLEVYDFVKDKNTADKYSIDKIPAMLVTDDKGTDTGIRFFGVPGGYEINSFLTSINEVSGSGEELPGDMIERIKKIDKDVRIEVFITLTCPYCPQAVATAHRIALENPKIKADMVESSTFQHLAIKYNVSSVPKIVINETLEFIGAQPVSVFLEQIEKL
ncbi:MAG: protein disulfide oxidoreductase [Spirochaetota bacterium]